MNRRKFLQLVTAVMIATASTTGFGKTKLPNLADSDRIEVIDPTDRYFEFLPDIYGFIEEGDYLEIANMGMYQVISSTHGEKTHLRLIS